MEQRNSKYARQWNKRESERIEVASKSDDSAFFSSPGDGPRSQEAIQTFRKKKSTSVSANVVRVLPGSGRPYNLDLGARRARSASESSTVKRSTIELLQNLTSIIVHTRKASASPPPPSSTSAVSRDSSLQAMAKLVHQPSISWEESPQAETVKSTLNEDNPSGMCMGVDLTEHFGDIQESSTSSVKAFEPVHNRIDQSNNSVKATISEEIFSEESGGDSSCLVDFDDDRHNEKSDTKLALSEACPRLSSSSQHRGSSEDTTKMDRFSQKVGQLHSNSTGHFTQHYVTDYSKKTDSSGEAKIHPSTQTNDVSREASSLAGLSRARSVDLTTCCNRPRKGNLSSPQVFDRHEAPQKFRQRSSEQTPPVSVREERTVSLAFVNKYYSRVRELPSDVERDKATDLSRKKDTVVGSKKSTGVRRGTTTAVERHKTANLLSREKGAVVSRDLSTARDREKTTRGKSAALSKDNTTCVIKERSTAVERYKTADVHSREKGAVVSRDQSTTGYRDQTTGGNRSAVGLEESAVVVGQMTIGTCKVTVFDQEKQTNMSHHTKAVPSKKQAGVAVHSSSVSAVSQLQGGPGDAAVQRREGDPASLCEGLPPWSSGDDSNGSGTRLQDQVEQMMSDSESTISAQSSEEMTDNERDGEQNGILAEDGTSGQRRSKRKREGFPDHGRESNGGGEGRKRSDQTTLMSTSERRRRDARVKKTQAQKLLAKSKANKSLRQRQQRARESAVTQDSEGVEVSTSKEIGADEESSERDTVRKSQRKMKGKRMLYVSDTAEELTGEEFSPSAPKRRKKATSHTSRSHTPLRKDPPIPQPMGDLLAKILTDIPEVDICSSASSSTTTPTIKLTTPTNKSRKKSKISTPSSASVNSGMTPKRHHNKSDIENTTPRKRSSRRTITSHNSLESVAESPRLSPNLQDRRSNAVLPRLYDQILQGKSPSSSSNCPSPEVGMQNRKKSRSHRRAEQKSQESSFDDRVLEYHDESRTHYRVLMSWESDYLRGSKATRGPILYAMEKVPDQLNSIKGPWMNKAKFIWTTWRHKVSPKVRKIYSAKAKENRKELFGRSKIILNIRRPPLKLDTPARSSFRKPGGTQLDKGDQRGEQGSGSQHQTSTTSSRRRSKRKERSLDSSDGVEGGEILSSSETSSSPSGGVDPLTEEARQSEVSKDTQTESVATFKGQSSSCEGNSPSSDVTTPKRSIRSSHTPSAGRPSPIASSSPKEAFDRPISLRTRSTTISPPHPPSCPATADTMRTHSSTRSLPPPPPAARADSIPAKTQTNDSVQFTDGSLKVSVKRTRHLSLSTETAPTSVVGTGLGARKPTDKTVSKTSPAVTGRESHRSMTVASPTTIAPPTASIVSVTELPSSLQLAEFFTSLSPLPLVSPKQAKQTFRDSFTTQKNSPPKDRGPISGNRQPSPHTVTGYVQPFSHTLTSDASTCTKEDSPVASTRQSYPRTVATNVSTSTKEKSTTARNQQLFTYTFTTAVPTTTKNSSPSSSSSNKQSFPHTVTTSAPSSTPMHTTSPSNSSSAAQYSITTQARLSSPTSTGTSQWERKRFNDEKPKTKPTPTSIYQQLIADKKIKLKGEKNTSKKKTSAKSQTRKKPTTSSLKSPSSDSTKRGSGEAAKKKSTKEGLSSKLSAPLRATFPTFVIPHIPMGGGNDSNVIVSPVWLGPGSFSSMMSTMPPQAPPNATPTTLAPYRTAQAPPNATPTTLAPYHAAQAPPNATPTTLAPYRAAQAPPHATPTANITAIATPTAPPTISCVSGGNSISTSRPQGSTRSTGNVLYKSSSLTKPQNALSSSKQQVRQFQFGNQQLGTFQSQQFPGIALLPVTMPLNRPNVSSNTTITSAVKYSIMAPRSTSTAKSSANTAPSNSTASKQNGKPATCHNVLSNASTLISKTTARGTAVHTLQAIPLTVSAPQPTIDMYPDDVLTPGQQMRKTLSYRPLNEQPHSEKNTTFTTATSATSHKVHRSRPMSLSTTPMSPPTSLPTNKPKRFRFPSVSSALTPSSGCGMPSFNLTGVRATLISPSSLLPTSSFAATTTTTTTSPSLSTPPGSDILDVNGMEYRRLILKKVQQWNEQKNKMLQRGADRTKSASPSLSVIEGSLKSPTFDSEVASFSSSVGPGVTGNLSDAQPFWTRSDSLTESTSDISLDSSSTPRLLTVGPPVTFAETLQQSPRFSASSLDDSKSFASTMTSPAISSVASSTIRMEDVLTASYSGNVVAPSIVMNSAFMGDISSMSRWELEQLYQHNLEKLEQQKKFIHLLEAHLKRIREQHNTFNTHKPSQTEVYQRFLSFIVEPEVVPDVPLATSDKYGYGHLLKNQDGEPSSPSLNFSEVIKGGTFDRPVMNEKYDFYANFGCS